MIARICSLLARWWVSFTSVVQTPRATHRRLSWEQCEPRVVFSATPTDYVTALYRDILHRAPDQAGLDSYNDQLRHGVSQAQVANSIWSSVEHRSNEVDGFYKTFLHRDADPAGRQYYVDQLLARISEESVMYTILTSDEYVERNPLGKDYVTALYHDILGRNPDSEGLASWVDRLRVPGKTYEVSDTYHLSDAWVAWNFVNSQEHHQQVVDSHYEKNLQRAPDPVGEAYWMDQLGQGMREDTVALAFMTSPEYRADYPVKLEVS